MTVLTVEAITCGYGGPPVVREVSFRAHQGEVLCVLGPNGCGKTTLLRALAGTLPFQGRVAAAGLDVATARPDQLAQRVALMPQLAQVYFPYTVYETVALGRYPHRRGGLLGGETAQDRAVVADCMARTGLGDLWDRPITRLSGGQLQRVFLARTFAQDPQVILLDEPTNHLDLKYQLELTRYLRDWVQGGARCVVGVLHDVNLALSFADRLLLMEGGRVTAQGGAEGFDLSLLSRTYGMDVEGYMKDSLTRWDRHEEG